MTKQSETRLLVEVDFPHHSLMACWMFFMKGRGTTKGNVKKSYVHQMQKRVRGQGKGILGSSV